MILTYHKISFFYENEITINIFRFIYQMNKLKKYSVVYLNEYDLEDKHQFVITFDDGYQGIVKYAIPVLKWFKYPFEVFVCEKFLKNGGIFIGFDDLQKIIRNRGRLQYHSKNHYNLLEINDLGCLENEIKCPEYLKQYDLSGFNYFAYPYWHYNEKIIDIVKRYYKGARSGNGLANGTIWALNSIKSLDNKFTGDKNEK